MRPGKRRLLPDTELGRLEEGIERLKSSIRGKVEHRIHIIKNLLGLKKARYRGLAKNTAQLYTLFGLADLEIAKKRLFALQAQGASWDWEMVKMGMRKRQNRNGTGIGKYFSIIASGNFDMPIVLVVTINQTLISSARP